MRSMLPDLRTLPSSTLATLSAFAIVATSTDLSLNENDDVRAITRNCGTCPSMLSSSSDSPSEKYACPGSGLRLTNGNTAIECGSGATTVGLTGAGRNAGWPWKYQPSASTINSTTTLAKRLLPRAAGSKRSPCGVSSSTHASASANGNPNAATRMDSRSALGGRLNAGKPIDATCTASQATTR